MTDVDMEIGEQNAKIGARPQEYFRSAIFNIDFAGCKETSHVAASQQCRSAPSRVFLSTKYPAFFAVKDFTTNARAFMTDISFGAK